MFVGDATLIDTASRFKLEPWSFTPLIFKDQVRRKKEFWGMLGFIKHLKESTAQKKTLKQGDTNKFIINNCQQCWNLLSMLTTN